MSKIVNINQLLSVSIARKKFLGKDFIEKVMNHKVSCSYFFVVKINNYICLFLGMRRKNYWN